MAAALLLCVVQRVSSARCAAYELATEAADGGGDERDAEAHERPRRGVLRRRSSRWPREHRVCTRRPAATSPARITGVREHGWVRRCRFRSRSGMAKAQRSSRPPSSRFVNGTAATSALMKQCSMQLRTSSSLIASSAPASAACARDRRLSSGRGEPIRLCHPNGARRRYRRPARRLARGGRVVRSCCRRRREVAAVDGVLPPR